MNASLTNHFRNLLRRENPSWTIAEIMRWKWEGGPVHDFKKVETNDMDSRYPGGTAIGLMFHDIKRGAWETMYYTKFVW